MKKIIIGLIFCTAIFAQETNKARREVYIPFNIHTTGYYTLGVGYRWGIKQDACIEIEGNYGSISVSAHDPYTGISTSASCDMYGGGIAVVYGNNMGIKYNDQTTFGAGARLSPMYIEASADYYYTELNVGVFTLIPYVLGVLELPVFSLEANLALLQNSVSPGFRIGLRL